MANNAFIYEGRRAQEIQGIQYVNDGGNTVRLPLPLQNSSCYSHRLDD